MKSPISSLHFFPMHQVPTSTRRHDRDRGTKLTYLEGGISIRRIELSSFVTSNPSARLAHVVREDGSVDPYLPASRDVLALELSICPTCLRADDHVPHDTRQLIYSARMIRAMVGDGSQRTEAEKLALSLFDETIARLSSPLR